MKRALIGILACAMCGAAAMGQPDDRVPASEKQEAREREGASERGSDAIRARLEVAIERGEEQLARNREALERLKNGESPTSVLRALRADAQRGPIDNAKRDEQRDERPSRRDRSADDDRQRHRLEEVRAFVREHIPEFQRKIDSVAEKESPFADRLMAQLAPMIEDVMRSFKDDPAFGRLKLQELRSGLGFVEAMRVYRDLEKSDSATDEDRVEAQENLRAAAEARFDAKMKLREYEITKLTEQLLEMSSTLKEMRTSRNEQIEQMINATTAADRHHHPDRRDRRPPAPEQEG
jgi:TolA-binding protein